MEQTQLLSKKILNRAKKIYDLAKAKDIINWYDNKKLAWFEKQIKKTKQKRNKKFEKQIMIATAITWNKLKNYEASLESRSSDNKVLIKTIDGRIFLVDADELENNGGI